MNLSTAFNIFVRQSLREGGIPFMITTDTPDQETVSAMLEAEFVRAIEKSESNYTPSREPKGRELTESHELLDFLKKRKEVHG